MEKRITLIICMLLGILILTPALCRSAEITIISKNLSHRIVALDTVEKRLKLLIGFAVSGDLPSGPEGTSAFGRLSFNGDVLTSYTLPKLDFYGGNLAFYLPYNVAPGDYTLYLELTDTHSSSNIGSISHTIENIETIGARDSGASHNWMQSPSIPLHNPPDETLGAVATTVDSQRGFILWYRNPFKYVYPNSAPQPSDVISKISVKLAQNEYKPATFSLYALKNLGDVMISVSDITGSAGAIVPSPDIYIAKTVPRVISRASPGSGHELRPRFLEKGNSVQVNMAKSQRIWMTFHATVATSPGQYNGTITIKTDLGSIEVPFDVEVLPFALVERPDKEYGFEMTYVFQEMTAQDLTEEQRGKVYENGLKYYQSFRNHGLTTVIPHSPYVFRRLPDGHPDLRDLEAALKAFAEAGFSGPFIYYCGHLVQSSKPGWAGSSLGFDASYHPLLMKEIIAYARLNFPEMARLDIYWMPGDEVHDDRDGPSRAAIAETLLNAIKEVNEKTAISIKAEVAWPVDIKFDDQPLNGEPWYYPNKQTTTMNSVDDAASIRRQFGLYHVKSPYVGIAPWTFQTSENAAGDPYTDLDTSPPRAEVMVAYPGLDGPALTPEYEAVREGIDDGRYAYVLEVLIEDAKKSTMTALRDLAIQAEAAYQLIINNIEGATLEDMDANRETMTEWILRIHNFTDDTPPPPDTVPSQDQGSSGGGCFIATEVQETMGMIGRR